MSAAEALYRILSSVNEATARDGGWAHLPAVSGHIGKHHPSFDARNFDFRRLSDLVRHQRYVEC